MTFYHVKAVEMLTEDLILEIIISHTQRNYFFICIKLKIILPYFVGLLCNQKQDFVQNMDIHYDFPSNIVSTMHLQGKICLNS